MTKRKFIGFARFAGLATVILALSLTLFSPQLALAQKDDEGEVIPIAYGDTVSGSITDDQYEVVYSFDGQAGDVVSISMTATSGSLDTYLLLYDAYPSENPLAFDDDGGEGFNSLLEAYTLPSTATYYIVARRFGRENGFSTGDFTLTLATGVAGGNVSGGAFGGLPTSGGEDLAFVCNGVTIPAATLVTFADVRPGFTYRVTVLGLDGFDPVIGLEAEDGSSLCNDDEPLAAGSQVAVPGTGLVTANALTSQVTFTTSGAIGDIYMRIGGFGGQGGRYVAVFEGMAIAPSTEQDAATLEVSESIMNETIYVYMVSRTTALDPYMRLEGTGIICDDAGIGTCADTPAFPGGGVSINNGNTYVAGGLDAGLGVVPGSTGELTFLFESFGGNSAGDYAMIVIGAAPGAGSSGGGVTTGGGQTTGTGPTSSMFGSTAVPIQYGVPVQGTINNTSFYQIYTFWGEIGQTVTITMTGAAGASLVPLVGLLSYSDNVLIEDLTTISYTLGYTGNYYIFATRDNI
ncbi:MAG: PPC domain-containing protein, partial [Anaerolineae bacterium]|nr:PPC domain-containing protein [Anaerolineae bacterium]